MHFLGIDIGGTKIKYVILDEESTILEKNQILTEDNSSELP
ncbi:ROK family protein, partial [Eudoraea sp.]